ncbi:hypothetical protein [Winogradskyella rapida]|uniref:Lipoprotein n=1 Tax=Winogradskyella rapida TaxID=549701 RepID=A0ABW3KMK5_9FLAO
MKNILLFIFFITLFSSCEKEKPEQLHTLVIKKEYCVIENEGIIFLPEFELRRNDSLISTHKTEIITNYYNIENLKSGNYNIVYTSLFKRTESQNIILNNKSIDTLIICLDKIDYSSIDHIPFIDRLKENENYLIDVYNQGCFSLGGATMKISKTQSKIIAEADENKKELTSSEIQYVRQFELELVNMNSCCCTSTDYYSLEYNDEVLKIEDGSCNWYGYGRLYNNLFNVEN